MSAQEDRIVYLLKTAPGGVDGRDHTDKGGALVMASFFRTDVAKRWERDTRYQMSAIVVDVTQARKMALAKLDLLDRLVLGVEEEA